MRGTRSKRRLVRLLGVPVLVLLALAVVEGGASLLLVGHEVVTRTGFGAAADRREGSMTRFDAELGWTANPGFEIVDAFGPGRDLRIGEHGFRGTRPVPRAVPAGRIRAIASGDSFTFGTGVGDHETWCEQLALLEPRLEPVNLGLGGYGIDQSYLRYRRDADELEHQLHLFAFISEDILRAVTPTSWGAPKPRLVVEGESLRVTGVPLEQVPGWRRSMRRAGNFLRELRSVELVERALGTKSGRPQLSEDDEARTLAVRIFAELAKLAEERGCTLALIHLPIETEYAGGSADVLRSFFRTECARRGIAWIDLFDEFRALPPEEHASLYLHAPQFGAGHYNAKGTAFVARVVLEKLRGHATIRERLGAP